AESCSQSSATRCITAGAGASETRRPSAGRRSSAGLTDAAADQAEAVGPGEAAGPAEAVPTGTPACDEVAWRQAGQVSTDSTWGRPGATQLDCRISTSSVPQRVQMVAARAQPGQKATWVMP